MENNRIKLDELVAEMVEVDNTLTKKAAKASIVAFKKALITLLYQNDCDSKFVMPGYGSFYVSKSKERKGRNPKTGEEITIPASKKLAFKSAFKF